MTYAVVRVLEGTSTRTPQELSDIAEQELMPQLAKSGGLLRYTTLTFSAGRIGSFTAYQDKDAAEHGVKVATEWLEDTGAMADYEVVQTLQGEVCYTLNDPGNKPLKGASGVGRIYETSASGNEVRAALEPFADQIKDITGFLRLNAIKLDDGTGIAVFSAFQTAAGVGQLTELASSKRAESGSSLRQVLPNNPKTMELKIIDSFTP